MPGAPPAHAASVMFSVAEVSGDLHAADLARELRRLQPSLSLFGAGGDQMAAAGVDIRIDITEESTLGLWGIAASLPRHIRNLYAIASMLRRERPDLVVLVDAPGLNFPIARVARFLDIPRVYYVPPQTWLWNPEHAADRLRRSVDLAVAVFEREEALYRKAGVPVAYYGHPLAGLAGACGASREEARRRLGFARDATVVGLFPGSRKREISTLLPSMLEAVGIAAARVQPLHVVVAAASARLRPSIERKLGGHNTPVLLLERAPDALAASDVILAASGTVLLEAVAYNVPAVMTYRLDGLTSLYAGRVLKLRRALSFYSIPNITAGEAVIPELVQDRATPSHMAEAVISLLTDLAARQKVLDGYSRVRARLGRPGAASRLAAHILDSFLETGRSASAL